jgi:dipeptidyl aminopeptidase/acylaminoacyl peptidase
VPVKVTVVGARIAFSSSTPLFHEIWLMDPDGQNPTKLTTSTEDGSTQPAWSPDRSKIAFTRNVGGASIEIFVMDADGQNPVQLTSNFEKFNSEPAWSPTAAGSPSRVTATASSRFTQWTRTARTWSG